MALGSLIGTRTTVAYLDKLAAELTEYLSKVRRELTRLDAMPACYDKLVDCDSRNHLGLCTVYLGSCIVGDEQE
jgi:hypothetical protein